MTSWFFIWSISTNIPMILVNFLGIHNSVLSKNIGCNIATLSTAGVFLVHHSSLHNRCYGYWILVDIFFYFLFPLFTSSKTQHDTCQIFFLEFILNFLNIIYSE